MALAGCRRAVDRAACPRRWSCRSGHGRPGHSGHPAGQGAALPRPATNAVGSATPGPTMSPSPTGATGATPATTSCAVISSTWSSNPTPTGAVLSGVLNDPYTGTTVDFVRPRKLSAGSDRPRGRVVECLADRRAAMGRHDPAELRQRPAQPAGHHPGGSISRRATGMRPRGCRPTSPTGARSSPASSTSRRRMDCGDPGRARRDCARAGRLRRLTDQTRVTFSGLRSVFISTTL